MRRTSRYRQVICGVDEAGRGPLAGPVVVAAVVLDRASPIDGLADSKALDAATREALFAAILATASVATAVVGVDRIDAANIRGATHWGMCRAVAGLCAAPTVALIDGHEVPTALTTRGRALIRGDARSASIAAASIVAKVTRDRLMERLAAAYPGYGFERHKGYPTPEHREVLWRLGPCALHRRSFAPVRAAVARFAAAA